MHDIGRFILGRIIIFFPVLFCNVVQSIWVLFFSRVMNISNIKMTDHGVEMLLEVFPGVEDLDLSKNLELTNKTIESITSKVSSSSLDSESWKSATICKKMVNFFYSKKYLIIVGCLSDKVECLWNWD